MSLALSLSPCCCCCCETPSSASFYFVPPNCSLICLTSSRFSSSCQLVEIEHFLSVSCVKCRQDLNSSWSSDEWQQCDISLARFNNNLTSSLATHAASRLLSSLWEQFKFNSSSATLSHFRCSALSMPSNTLSWALATIWMFSWGTCSSGCTL